MAKKIYTDQISDVRFVKFIQKHHVLTLATVLDNQPWCSACFYAYEKKTGSFVFTSDENTRHINELLLNSKVAANIYFETKVIGIIQGLQISGTVELIDDHSSKDLRASYLKKFPFAVLSTTSLWALYPKKLKLTDNTLGFGTKLIWEKEL